MRKRISPPRRVTRMSGVGRSGCLIYLVAGAGSIVASVIMIVT